MGVAIHSDTGNLQGFLDEAGTGDDGPALCSAGYLFEPDGADLFRDTWAPFLASQGLECFHATDCFRRIDWEEISSALVDLIKKTAFRGFVRFMQRNTMSSVQREMRRSTGSEYSLCTLSCMEAMAEIARRHNRRIEYFIEDGNEFAGELRHFLNLIKSNPDRKAHFAMAGAGTYSKREVIQLQAADFLGWEFRRSAYRDGFTDNIRALVNGKDEPGNPGHHVSGFSDISASIYGMVNAFYGLHSNRKRFKS
jgi:hypothetical protein